MILGMTRTGFPFLPEEASNDMDIMKWTKGLFIRFVAGKQLLISHIEDIEEYGLETSTDLFYRVFRYLNHDDLDSSYMDYIQNKDDIFLAQAYYLLKN